MIEFQTPLDFQAAGAETLGSEELLSWVEAQWKIDSKLVKAQVQAKEIDEEGRQALQNMQAIVGHFPALNEDFGSYLADIFQYYKAGDLISLVLNNPNPDISRSIGREAVLFGIKSLEIEL